MKKLLSLQLGGSGHPTMSSPSRAKSPRETGDRGEGEEETASVAGLGDLDTLSLSRRSSVRTSNVPLTPHGRTEKPCKCCEKGCSVVGRLRQQLQNLREEKTQLEDMISMQTATLHQIDQVRK
ncbi:hypothetical protein TGPRC2_361420 [Toxoplasma gondii TgCatPRC2]|uniref:Uncharacterized protein n=5 Tax=Toxoplasma gondii TaxID=5811 RepID=A0A151HRZ2_TOXGO|nr:hypothetical protein TGP89_361420 [Toxoplasma gondii p89]KFG51266.1 hypothetical protein TGFOU_361420 [Toxoplasma gondii FOU]KFH04908.1 hypothetical protein TGVAND_242790A [Toxoplasma gondii VAND]KYK72176.1 hypothetical protein TGPRC2_361420 [Toxoplasma gondii TgCatPRC2]PUA87209.1 hypothetical protein TGBR9_361420 [Toxoplasma gondii TgCATBr9]